MQLTFASALSLSTKIHAAETKMDSNNIEAILPSTSTFTCALTLIGFGSHDAFNLPTKLAEAEALVCRDVDQTSATATAFLMKRKKVAALRWMMMI